MVKAPKDTRTTSEQVAWVKHLPNEGGDWGRGIVSTVASFESAADDLENNLAKLQAEHDAAVASLRAKFGLRKSEVSGRVRARRRLATDAVKRAEAESTTLYADAQIGQAKAKEAADVMERARAKSPSDQAEERVEGRADT